MKTLAIDTSTTRGVVALLHDDQPVIEQRFERDGLFEALQTINPGKLDLIVIGTGPGSFTGIRAAIAAAKGLALPANTPLKAVPSFDALALTLCRQMPRDCGQLCVFADARRDEIYFALYDREARPLQPVRLGTLEMIADEVHFPFWFLSPEMPRYADAVREVFGGFATLHEPPAYPSAAALGWLGRQRFLADPRSDLQPEPIYLRQPDYKKAPTGGA